MARDAKQFKRLIVRRAHIWHVIHCPECGQLKSTKNAEQIYCSQPCAKAAQRKARTGNAYKQWKKAVLERDGYTCQFCGAKEPENKIIAHHIMGLGENPELKLELSNGMSLCLICHDIVHGRSDVGSVDKGVFGNRRGRKMRT